MVDLETFNLLVQIVSVSATATAAVIGARAKLQQESPGNERQGTRDKASTATNADIRPGEQQGLPEGLQRNDVVLEIQ